MTTTAEKINKLIRDIGIMSDDLHQIRKELEALRKQDISPPAPKPLECWVNIYKHNAVGGAYAKEETAQKFCEVEGRVVRMREVTPQDEQDRKDAARYRKAKMRQMSLHGSMRDQWDEIIGKATEE